MPSPIMTAVLQAATLSTLSNVIAQIIEARRPQVIPERHSTFDIAQLLRFVALTFITCPANYMWQQFLERTFPAYQETTGRSGGAGAGAAVAVADDLEKGADKVEIGGGGQAKPRLNVRNTLTKWFVDCITCGALMNTVAFLLFMGIMKGYAWWHIWYNIKNETIPIIVAGYKVWPIASIISFSCVPVERRIVFLSFVGLLWGTYMSLIAARI